MYKKKFVFLLINKLSILMCLRVFQVKYTPRILVIFDSANIITAKTK